MNKVILKRLKQDAEKRVSDYFMQHDFQMVLVNRGDLRKLIADYERKSKPYRWAGKK